MRREFWKEEKINPVYLYLPYWYWLRPFSPMFEITCVGLYSHILRWLKQSKYSPTGIRKHVQSTVCRLSLPSAGWGKGKCFCRFQIAWRIHLSRGRELLKREDSTFQHTCSDLGLSCFLRKEYLKLVLELSEKKGRGCILLLSILIITLILLPAINGAFLAFHCLFCLSFSIVRWVMYTAYMFNRFLQSSSCKLNELLKEMLSWRLTCFPIIVLFSSFPSPFCKISI